jgi:ABC-type uncharacterized transport system ATPase subunit
MNTMIKDLKPGDRVELIDGAVATTDAWRKPVVAKLVERMARGGLRVVVGPPTALRKTMVRRDVVTGKIYEREVTMTPPDAQGMQWGNE